MPNWVRVPIIPAGHIATLPVLLPNESDKPTQNFEVGGLVVVRTTGNQWVNRGSFAVPAWHQLNESAALATNTTPGGVKLFAPAAVSTNPIAVSPTDSQYQSAINHHSQFDDLTCWKEMFLAQFALFKGEAHDSEVLDAVRAATPESRRAFEVEYGEIETEAQIICPVVDGGWVEVFRLTEDSTVEKVRHEGDTAEAKRLREAAQQQGPVF